MLKQRKNKSRESHGWVSLRILTRSKAAKPHHLEAFFNIFASLPPRGGGQVFHFSSPRPKHAMAMQKKRPVHLFEKRPPTELPACTFPRDDRRFLAREPHSSTKGPPFFPRLIHHGGRPSAIHLRKAPAKNRRTWQARKTSGGTHAVWAVAPCRTKTRLNLATGPCAGSQSTVGHSNVLSLRHNSKVIPTRRAFNISTNTHRNRARIVLVEWYGHMKTTIQHFGGKTKNQNSPS